jgi:hypothetical protein
VHIIGVDSSSISKSELWKVRPGSCGVDPDLRKWGSRAGAGAGDNALTPLGQRHMDRVSS